MECFYKLHLSENRKSTETKAGATGVSESLQCKSQKTTEGEGPRLHSSTASFEGSRIALDASSRVGAHGFKSKY